MRLNSVRLINFRQHADTVVDFDLGLTGIIGPNGSGKSTILEAIAWALYGMPAARGTRESIRFSRAPARAAVKVELDFELAGHRYQVHRGLTSAELYLDGADAPIANSITGVTELLRRRIGMSREEFFNTYFTGQKELSVMAAMGPSDRAQFLSRVLGYEKLRTAQGMVRDQRRLISAELAGLRSAMPDPVAVQQLIAESATRVAAAEERRAAAERRQQECERTLADLAPRWATAQREREQLQEVLSELRVAESETVGAARDVERLQRELADITAARTELEALAAQLAPLDDVASEYHTMENLWREEGRRQTLSESVRALEAELVRLDERRAKIESAPHLVEEVAAKLEATRTQLKGTEQTLEERRTEWVRDRQEAETKRQALRTQFAELRDQRERIVAAGEEGACPTCARPLGGQFRSVLELLDGQLETVRVDGNYFKARMEQLAAVPEDVRALDEQRRAAFDEVGALERRLAKAQAAMQERLQIARDVAEKEERLATLRRDLAALPAGYDPARHEALRREIDRLTPLDARAARLSAQIEREPQITRDLAAAVEQQRTLAGRIEALRERRQAASFSEQDFASLRGEHERCQADLRAAELAVVAARADHANAEAVRQAAQAAQQELERTEQRVTALQTQKRLHDELDRAYSDIRTDLNQQLRPEVSELASAFLTELTDARYSQLELDDQYNILVLEDGVPKPVISGGEEDLANLVLRLAISQMIAERAGQQFSLLILDEVFGSLDEARRHNVVDLLRRLHDRFEQVILITHVESIREGLDRVISVRYDEGSASARVMQEDEMTPTIESSELQLDLARAGAAD